MVTFLATFVVLPLLSSLFNGACVDSRDPNPCDDSSWNALAAGLGL